MKRVEVVLRSQRNALPLSLHSCGLWTFVKENPDRKKRCCHLNVRFCTCFEQGVHWHSGNYRVLIHSETRTWHGKNIQSNAPNRSVLKTQVNHLASLAKWLSVRLRNKWLWFQSRCCHLSFSYSACFEQGVPWPSGKQSADSLWNPYVTW